MRFTKQTYIGAVVATTALFGPLRVGGEEDSPVRAEAIRRASNLLQNASFEINDSVSLISGWSGQWYADKVSRLSKLEPEEFLSADDSVAKEGKHSVRIRSPRNEVTRSEELLKVHSDFTVPIVAGTSYVLTGFWRSNALIGKLYAYFHTHKRTYAPKLEFSEADDGWQRFRGRFIPETGEEWCDVNVGLYGKKGTLWLDELSLTWEPASILRLMPPNVIKKTGICLLTGNIKNEDLTLVIQLRDCGSGTTLGKSRVPVRMRSVRFALPGYDHGGVYAVTATIVDRNERELDSQTARIVPAERPFF